MIDRGKIWAWALGILLAAVCWMIGLGVALLMMRAASAVFRWVGLT